MALFALLFLVVPIVELFVIVQVAQGVGIGETILLLIAVSLVGAWLVKRQGVAVWQQLNQTINQGQIPHREIVDGALILFAGALMLTPGFVTDVLGLLLLLPPSRAVVRNVLMTRFKAGRVVMFGAGRFNSFRAGGAAGAGGSEVWDAESWETDPGSGSPRGTGELDK
jgi:UPF0716 protein FxsA